jgi:hypothetical protein
MKANIPKAVLLGKYTVFDFGTILTPVSAHPVFNIIIKTGMRKVLILPQYDCRCYGGISIHICLLGHVLACGNVFLTQSIKSSVILHQQFCNFSCVKIRILFCDN